MIKKHFVWRAKVKMSTINNNPSLSCKTLLKQLIIKAWIPHNTGSGFCSVFMLREKKKKQKKTLCSSSCSLWDETLFWSICCTLFTQLPAENWSGRNNNNCWNLNWVVESTAWTPAFALNERKSPPCRYLCHYFKAKLHNTPENVFIAAAPMTSF